MKISIGKILSYGPCDAWPRERMLAVTGGREEFDTSELVNMDIPTPDLVWLTGAILSSHGNRDEYLLKSAFAERVLPIYESEYPNDTRPRAAIRAARIYALGESNYDELAEASYSASYASSYAAAAAAAAAAASTAAYSVSYYAAAAAAAAAYSYAAEAATDAYSATDDAASYSASEAATDDERAAQREICAVFLRNMED